MRSLSYAMTELFKLQAFNFFDIRIKNSASDRDLKGNLKIPLLSLTVYHTAHSSIIKNHGVWEIHLP